MTVLGVLFSILGLMFLLILALYCWCAHLSGLIRGLTGEIKPKPSFFRDIARPKSGQSALYTPKGYEDDDERMGLRAEEEPR